MIKRIVIVALSLVLIQIVSSCGSKKDCYGNKKTYNKQGGFWM